MGFTETTETKCSSSAFTAHVHGQADCIEKPQTKRRSSAFQWEGGSAELTMQAKIKPVSSAFRARLNAGIGGLHGL